MRNIFKLAVAVGVTVAACIAPQKAEAQAGAGWDYFAVPRTAIIIAPETVTGSGTITSNYIDRIGYAGVGKITVFSWGAGSSNATGTVTVLSSPDLTNWFKIPYGQATATATGIITNSAFAVTNVFLTCTNTNVLPVISNSVNIASAGFPGPYASGIPFTNTNPIALSTNGASAVIDVGVNLSDCNRYISAYFSTTNAQVIACTVTGRKEGN